MHIDEAMRQAEPGPFEINDVPGEGYHIESGDGRLGSLEDYEDAGIDAALFVHCRNHFGELLAMAKRYRNETPLGHQPRRIALAADELFAKCDCVDGI